MQKWRAVFLCVAVILSMTSCSSKLVDPNSAEKAPVQEPALQETETEAETETPEIPAEDPKEEQKIVFGIWSSEEGMQQDPVLEYHNYYVCLLENGIALRYGWRLMDIGTWSITDNGEIHAYYDEIFSFGQGEGWEKSDYSDAAVYLYEEQTDKLGQISCTEEGEFSNHSIYYAANRVDAFEKAVNHIVAYQNYGNENWLTQLEMNAGSATVAALYTGLEQCVYRYTMQSMSKEDAANLEKQEAAWQADKELQLESVQKTYEGGSMMAMMVSSKNASITSLRIEELLSMGETDEETLTFADLPDSFMFTSGAGGWATELMLAEDGSFTGRFYDSDMGDTGDGYSNGTVYICDFSGRFTQPVRIDELVWSIKLESMTVEQKPAEVYFEDDTRYISSDPYGMEDTEEFLLFLPGMSISEMLDEYGFWTVMIGVGKDETMPESLYGLLNVGAGHAFLGQKQ